jgi:hypothetical protein
MVARARRVSTYHPCTGVDAGRESEFEVEGVSFEMLQTALGSVLGHPVSTSPHFALGGQHCIGVT